MTSALAQDKDASIDYDSHGFLASLKLLRPDSTSLANDSASTPNDGIVAIIDAKSFIDTGFFTGIK